MLEHVVRGDLVTASQIVRGGYVGVAGGRIAYVGAADPGAAHTRSDRQGALIFPGVVDSHVHSRSQKDREDFRYSTKAALAGGVTTIVDMPYDEGLLICDRPSVEKKAADIAEQAHSDVALYGTIRPSDGAAKIAEQVEAGVCGFKFSTFGTHPERFPRIPPQVMAEAFAEIARFGLAAGVHNENDEIVRAAIARVRAEGRTDYLAHGMTHVPLAEVLAMAEIYEMGAFTGCRAHVVHCSLGRGIEICDSYKREGYDASVEVCIHYLLFDEDNTARRTGGLSKINPPLRPAVEKEKLWHFLAAGSIDLVSTDHVAWSLDRKNNPDMMANSSGGPSLEVLMPALVKECEDRSVDLTVAARVLSHNPARHFRLGNKGGLTVGKDADFSVVDTARSPWRVAQSQTVSDWSLYDGMELPQVTETFLRGEKVWDGMTILNAPGSGAFVKPAVAR
jgi:allantoinase